MIKIINRKNFQKKQRIIFVFKHEIPNMMHMMSNYWNDIEMTRYSKKQSTILLIHVISLESKKNEKPMTFLCFEVIIKVFFVVVVVVVLAMKITIAGPECLVLYTQ